MDKTEIYRSGTEVNIVANECLYFLLHGVFTRAFFLVSFHIFGLKTQRPFCTLPFFSDRILNFHQ